jgi:hypothetical protein
MGALVYHADPKDGTWISGRVQGAKAGEKVLTEMPIPERLRDGLDTRDLGRRWALSSLRTWRTVYSRCAHGAAGHAELLEG